MTVNCRYCSVEFSVRPSALTAGRGKFCSPKCQYDSKRGITNLKAYKGDNAAYSTIHGWVSRNWGKAAHCESRTCKGKSSYFEWANLNGAYRRIRKEWARMCRPCHRRYDIDNGLMGLQK